MFLAIFISTAILHCTPKPSYEVYFPPQQKCLPKVIKLIKNTKKNIFLQCYTFTSKPLAQALIDAHKKGIKVIIITDKSQIKAKNSCVIWLFKKGISVYIDHKVAIAHNKVMIIDNKTLLTGSYNWTHSAENRNSENLLVIYNHKDLLKAYLKNFKKRLKESKLYSTL